MNALSEMKGHTVYVFEDAQPALEEIDFDTVDLVITDLTMPTPGEKVIRTIRERGSQVHITVMAGHIPYFPHVEKALFLNFRGVWRRAFTVRSLRQALGVAPGSGVVLR